jgi:hypothetical protein
MQTVVRLTPAKMLTLLIPLTLLALMIPKR